MLCDPLTKKPLGAPDSGTTVQPKVKCSLYVKLAGKLNVLSKKLPRFKRMAVFL